MNETTKSRLRGLFALADDDRTSPTEVEAAVLRIRQILNRLGIDEAQARAQVGVGFSQAASIPDDCVAAAAPDWTANNQHRAAWQKMLLAACGDATSCKVIIDYPHGHIIGLPHRVLVCAYLYEQLVNVLQGLSSRDWSEHAKALKQEGENVYKYSNAQSYRNRWLSAWLQGAVSGVRVQIRQAREAEKREATSTALMVLDHENTALHLASMKAQLLFPNTTNKAVTRADVDVEAWMQGREQGLKTPIKSGLGGQNANHSKLP